MLVCWWVINLSDHNGQKAIFVIIVTNITSIVPLLFWGLPILATRLYFVRIFDYLITCPIGIH
jgi:hypothetical protein